MNTNKIAHELVKIAKNIVATDAVKFSFSYFDEGESVHNQTNIYITWYGSVDKSKLEDLIQDCQSIKEFIDKNFRQLELKFPLLFSRIPITIFNKGDLSGEMEVVCYNYEQVKAVIAEMKKLGWRG